MNTRLSRNSGTGRGFPRGYLTSAAAALGNPPLPSALPCAFVPSRTTICCCCARFDIFNPLRAWRERLRASKYAAPSLLVAKAREMCDRSANDNNNAFIKDYMDRSSILSRYKDVKRNNWKKIPTTKIHIYNQSYVMQ